MRVYERFGGIVGLAALCFFSAMTLIVIFPWKLTDADDATVTDIHGKRVKVRPYTDAERAGKETYQRQVCWHCHSQFVRPVNDEDKRWGPVSQAGESALDKPHVFSTRRIGPDLAREGGMRSDDWQFAHLWDPRSTVAESVMPGFTWLFEKNPNAAEVAKLLARFDYDGDGILTLNDDLVAPKTTDVATLNRIRGADVRGLPASTVKQTDTGADLLRGPDGKRAYEDVFTQITDREGHPTEQADGRLSDYDGGPIPSAKARNLIAYLQRLGTAIGPWRVPLAAPTGERGPKPAMVGVTDVKWTDSAGKPQTASVEDGKMPRRAFERRLYGDAHTNATPEVRNAARDLQLEYDALMAAWRKANPAWDKRLTDGEALFLENCSSCHGNEGRGNGTAAQFFPIRPRDFTQKAYRYRSTQTGNLPLDGDLFRTLWRGLPGTPMPSWRELKEEQLWLLVDYVEHFLETIGDSAPEFDNLSAKLAVPSVPKITAEQLDAVIKRGRAVFVAAKCANCHGSEGRADGAGWVTALDLGGNMRARDLKPRFPGDQPALRMRGGTFPQDLYRTIFTGLEGTAMGTSLSDFNTGWGLARKADALKAAGAPAAEIAQAEKEARRRLIVPLHEDLADVGVIKELDDKGTPTEYLDRLREQKMSGIRITQFGDDWALVFYTMDLLQVRNLIPLVK